MPKFLFPTLITLLILSLTSCRRSAAPVEVRRLDLALAGGTVPADTAMRRAADLLFAISGYGPLDPESAARYAANPSVTAHRAATDSAFADISPLEQSLGEVADGLARNLPAVRMPRVYTIISPFRQSVITADTIIFIGLNHYLGTSYEPYGYFPDYQRRRKIPSRIAPDVAEAIVRAAYPYSPSTPTPTALSAMLYEGAVAVAVSRIAGVTTDEAIGYTPGEAAELDRNAAAMWRRMVEERMVYSTDPAVARSLTALSPATAVISPDAPGAAGRRIGVDIVRAYASSHPDATLDDLLRLYLSPTALRDSGFGGY